MGLKNGNLFTAGHLMMPILLAAIYFQGNRDLAILTISGVALLWTFGLILWSGSSRTFLASASSSMAVTLISVMDAILLGAAFAVPDWTTGFHPTWLVPLMVSLYSFELGLRKTLLFTILALADLYLFGLLQPHAEFLSLDTLFNLLAVVLGLFFIGPTTDRLHRMAHYDHLTGLPNRRMLMDAVRTGLSELGKTSYAALLLFDLDGFKYINDTLGHMQGDKLLEAITLRLRKVLPRHVLLARMGGDEFGLYIPKMKTTDEAAELAELMLKQFTSSFSIGQQEVFVTSSIGIAIAPENGKDADTLMRNADAAMYLAKDQGRNNYQFYSAPTSKEGVERIKMEAMLRHALERDEFVVYYQPRVDTSTGQLMSVEALIRWVHPEKGMISPMDFIPLAEETGLIVPIGERVLAKVCEQRRAWTEMGMPPFKVSVNLSARQFRQTELPEVILNTLRSTGMPAALLELELTESAAMQDVNYAILMLRVLKEMGLTIAIDDFGTGYSSLSYLKRFPLDVLKIDKSFISGIDTESDDAAIASAIIAMAHSLKLRVTAEGVETAEQLLFLEEQRCDEIQGYYIGKPMKADVLEQWYQHTYMTSDETPA